VFCVVAQQSTKVFNNNQDYGRVSYSLLGLIVWFVKLILLERNQFMDKIGGEKIGNPYLVRLAGLENHLGVAS
jgi:hypothetical protein